MGVGYGQTECAALATLNSGEELIHFPESAGRPLPTVQLEIRDATGAALPDGEEGEICLRGPMVMPGYWRRPEATAEAIGPGRWLRTGDIGRIEGGRLYLASRRRDLIIRGGENIYPVEIENRLEEHPDVAEVAVIGVDARGARPGGARRSSCRLPGATLDADELARVVRGGARVLQGARRTGRSAPSRCRATRRARSSSRCCSTPTPLAVRRGRG